MTIGDLTTTGVVLVLDAVDEAVEDFTGAEAGQASAEDAAAAADDELARAQSTVLMASFEKRLHERNVAVQEQLRSQLEAIVNKQQLAHERMILALSTQHVVRGDTSEQQPIGATPASVDINPRLMAPVVDDFTTSSCQGDTDAGTYDITTAGIAQRCACDGWHAASYFVWKGI